MGTTVPVLPTNERHYRELTRLPEDRVADVWQRVVEQSDGEKITARAIKQFVDAEIGYQPPAPDYYGIVMRAIPKLDKKQRLEISNYLTQ